MEIVVQEDKDRTNGRELRVLFREPNAAITFNGCAIAVRPTTIAAVTEADIRNGNLPSVLTEDLSDEAIQKLMGAAVDQIAVFRAKDLFQPS